MQQAILFEPIPLEKIDLLSREDLIVLARGEQRLRIQIQRDNERLRALYEELKQRSFSVDDLLIVLKNKVFGKSSEKSKRGEGDGEAKKKSGCDLIIM